MTHRWIQAFYAVLALLGLVLTWHQNLRFALQHEGFPLGTFIADNFATPASASISVDILVVTAVFLLWSFLEARRLGMRHWWGYLLLTFGVALAVSLPVFLLMRERRLARRGLGTRPRPASEASPAET